MYVVAELDVERWTEESPPLPLVKKVGLDNLRGIEATGAAFLPNYVGLLDVDLSLVGTLRRIGNAFLFRCALLKHIDLAPLVHVTAIGPNFLHGCSGLATLDLRPLRRLRIIPQGFLSGCSGMTSLDLTPLTMIKDVHAYFLNGCTSLGPSVNLASFASVHSIGAYFLASCPGLTTLDVTPIMTGKRLQHPVGDHFLEKCTGLVALTLPPAGAPNPPRSIGFSFLHGCMRLAGIDLAFLHKVELIDSHFLHGCCALPDVDLTPFEASLRSVGGSFLYGCSGIHTLDLTPLQQLRTVGMYFLVGAAPSVIFTDDRPLLLDALKSAALLDRCCVVGLPYAVHVRTRLRSWLETDAQQQNRIRQLSADGEADRQVLQQLEQLQRSFVTLTGYHDRLTADADAMRQQLHDMTFRAETAEALVKDLQQAKAKVQAKYIRIRDGDVNAKLHEALTLNSTMRADWATAADRLQAAQSELQGLQADCSKFIKDFGSLANMHNELLALQEAQAEAKAIQAERAKKIKELHSRVKTEMDGKAELQARLVKVQQELQKLKMDQQAA